MAVTRINNNQITDASAGNVYLGIDASTKVQNYSITAGKIANNLVYGSDFTVSGNLTVNGTSTAIDTTITTIEDPVIVLASTQTGTPAVDIGFLGERGSSNNIAFVWQESSQEFVTAFTDTSETNTTINVVGYADLHTFNANVDGNLTIGGNIDITGNVTSLSVTGNITGGNLLTPGLISATGNIDGANINGANIFTGGRISATGNVFAGNLRTDGDVSATGNVYANNFYGNISGNVDAGGANTQVQFNDEDILNGSAGFTFDKTANLVTVTGNVDAANVNVTTGLTAITGYFTGNVDVLGNLNATIGVVYANSGIFYGNAVTGNNAAFAGIPGFTQLGSNVVMQFAGNVNSYSQLNFQNINSGNIASTDFIATADNGTDTTYYLDLGINSSTFDDPADYPGYGANDSYVHNHGGNLILNPESAGKAINFMVGGTDTTDVIGVVDATGLLVTGTVSANGTITGGNLATAGTASAGGNITGANILTGGLVSATATITGGNLETGGTASATGNITGGNLITAGLITSTGNITGGNVDTAGLITATGNVTGANILTGGIVSATGNITGANVETAKVYSATTLDLVAGAGNIVIGTTGNVVLANTFVNGVAYPVQNQDAASKVYVDNMVSTALAFHEAVVAATTGTLDSASGGTVSYDNGTAGVGATLTTTGAFTTIDTANVQTVGTRILVKNEANAAWNGAYEYTNATTLTRTTDADQYGPNSSEELSLNDYFFVSSGNVNLGSAWVVDAPTGTITFGTSDITFAQFSQTQVYSANTSAGLTLVGQTFNAKVDNDTTAFDITGNIIVKASANLVTPNIGAATGTSLSTTGTITAGNLVTGGTLSATGTATLGNVDTAGTVSATGNITGGNVLTGGLVSATGNVDGGNVNTVGNVVGGNVLTSGLISATATITGGNVETGGFVSATGNVDGANFNTAGQVSAGGNITGGNIATAGEVSAGGNIYAANFVGNVSGNITAPGANTQVVFNDDGIDNATSGFTFDKATGVVTAANAFSTTGNVNAANFNGGYLYGMTLGSRVLTDGNPIQGGSFDYSSLYVGFGGGGQGIALNSLGNAPVQINTGAGGANTYNWTFSSTDGEFVAPGNITTVGNINGANLNTSAQIIAVGNIYGGNLATGGDAQITGTATAGNLSTNGQLQAGNVIIQGDDITDNNGMLTFNGSQDNVSFSFNGDTTANILYIDGGTGTASFGTSAQTVNAVVAFNATNSVLFPVGNIGTRPSVGVTGMVRFNTTNNNLEVFDNSQWVAVGVPSFTVIADEQFYGDGSTVDYTLSTTQTTNSCIVAINGVVQIPGSAYSVSGVDPTCVLTFTEAPEPGDVIDVREITTTTSVTSISNLSGNAVVAVSDSDAQVLITGDLLPTGNLTAKLGSNTKQWSELHVGGNTIYLGNLQLKEVNSDTFAVYQADGTTEANIAVGNIDVTSIQSGTSSISISAPNGNAVLNVGGTNSVIATSTGAVITGTLSASGNITGNYILGNGSQLTGIDATSIQSGTSNVKVVSSSGNVTTSVGGTSNVVVISTAGQTVTGTISATGNITGANIDTAGTATIGTFTISGSDIISTGPTITIDPNASGGVDGLVIIQGNLQVNGNTTTINSNVVSTNDLTYNLANNATLSSQANGGGIEVGPVGSPFITWLYNSTANTWTTAGGISATGTITGGNITVGTGTITGGNIVNSNANGVGNIGSSSTYFNTVFAKATSAQYADLAEKYVADAEYAPGTVVVFGGTHEVTVNATDADRKVAGVVSTNPSYIMNGGLEAEFVATVALTGRVPCMVVGTVRKGDMMVAAGLGRARAEADPKVGTVIGKALEDFDGAEGTIEVVVGRF